MRQTLTAHMPGGKAVAVEVVEHTVAGTMHHVVVTDGTVLDFEEEAGQCNCGGAPGAHETWCVLAPLTPSGASPWAGSNDPIGDINRGVRDGLR